MIELLRTVILILCFPNQCSNILMTLFNYLVANFDVSLTVHLSITLDNDQLNAHFFKYIYYHPLNVHVSSNILLILRTSNCINTASGIVTLGK